MKTSAFRALPVLALVAAAMSAHATLTQVGDRASLGANDSIAWGQLGTPFTGVGSSANGTSALGNSFNLSAGNLERRDQNNGWAGNFNSGDELVWNTGSGSMTLSFATATNGVGFNMQRNQFGDFTGTVSAYDSSNNLLGSFNIDGTSTSAGDGSAVFLGFSSSAYDISSIVISEMTTNDFSINSVSLNSTGSPAAPAPAALASFGFGAIATLRRRRKA